MQRIAILGAGLFGRLLALSLSRPDQPAQWDITLFERDDLRARRSAGFAAAAMLAPLAEAASASQLITRLGIDSLTRWPALLAALPTPVFFQQTGSLVVSHPQDRGDYLNFIHHLQRQLGATGLTEHMRYCNAQQLRQLEPELAETFQSGLHLPLEGQLDNRALYEASRQALESSAVDCRLHTPVTAVEGTEVITEAGRQKFDRIVDCRGLGARQALPALRGVRGEVIRLQAPGVGLTRPIRLMHPRYPLYIAPKPGDEYVIGATQIESDDDSPISVRSTLELLSGAYSLHSGFAEARILETATSCRPALPDNEPRIHLNAHQLQVNGLYRHGYLIAPALLQEVTDTLQLDQDLATRRHNSAYPALYQPLEAHPS